MYLTRWAFLLPGLAIALCTLAQQQEAPVAADSSLAAMAMRAKHYGDSIAVRWMPPDATVWMLAKQDGYLLKRLVLRREANNTYTRVDSMATQLKPWALEQWAKHFQATGDSSALIAAQLLHGQERDPLRPGNANSMEAIFDKYSEQRSMHAFAAITADLDPAVARGMALGYLDRDIRPGFHYLYTVVPIQAEARERVETGRALVEPAAAPNLRDAPELSAIAGDKMIYLRWPRLNLEGGFAAYMIERSVDGKHFLPLNNRPLIAFGNREEQEDEAMRYDDPVPENYRTFHYRITGIDHFGDRSRTSHAVSAMAIDLTPPVPPMITSLTSVQGHVLLKWEKDDEEGDLAGYVVGRAHNLEGPFEPLHRQLLPPGTRGFNDPAPNAAAPNYYLVAAVDTARNAGRSQPSYVAVDDTLPPAPPTGLTGSVDTTGRVAMAWLWNREPDLAGYRVYFSNSPSDVFTPAHPHMLIDTLFADTIALRTLSRHIYYRVVAYDRNMNPSSPSQTLKLARPDLIPPVPAIIHDFQVTAHGVTIKWHPSASEDAARQRLFRQTDSTRTQLAELPITESVFSDTAVTAGLTYAYTIETIDSSGLSSGPSFPLNAYVHETPATKDIKGLTVLQQDGKTVLTWDGPRKAVDFYILFRSEEGTGLRMRGNIPGDQGRFEEAVKKGQYQYALQAVYKDGRKSLISEPAEVKVD